jgi:hypothetical protein
MNAKIDTCISSTMNDYKNITDCEEFMSSTTINILMLISFILGFLFFRHYRVVNKKLYISNTFCREERNFCSEIKSEEEIKEKIMNEGVINKLAKMDAKTQLGLYGENIIEDFRKKNEQ